MENELKDIQARLQELEKTGKEYRLIMYHDEIILQVLTGDTAEWENVLILMSIMECVSMLTGYVIAKCEK